MQNKASIVGFVTIKPREGHADKRLKREQLEPYYTPEIFDF